MTKVAIQKCYDYESVEEVVESCFALLGGTGIFIRPNMNILIKPNLCSPLPADKHATTHPLFVKALIRIIQRVGGNVFIGENSGGSIADCTQVAMERSGIEEVIRTTSAVWVNFQDGDWKEVEIRQGKYLHSILVPAALDKMDLIVNAPKFKTHNLTILSGAVKNMFGCVHTDIRKKVHREFRDDTRFAHALLDIYSYFTPGLTFIDAVTSMEGDRGPLNGEPVDTKFVLACTDGIAADTAAAYLTGHTSREMPSFINLAGKRKMGTADMREIQLSEDFADEISFQKVSYASSVSQALFEPVITECCRQCGVCLTSCPVQAISMNNEKMAIDSRKCIECLCCQEVCLYDAINIEPRSRKEKYGEGFDIIRFTAECNLACIFCTAHTPSTMGMSTVEVMKNLTYLKKNGSGRVALTGGEPTLRDDLVSIIQYAKGLGLKIQLQTNAVLLKDKALAYRLTEAGVDQFFVSLHGHTPELFCEITQSGQYGDVIKGIQNLVSAGADVAVNYVISQINCRSLIDFVEFIDKELGLRKLRLSFVNPNRFLNNDETVVPSLSQIHDSLIAAIRYCYAGGIAVDVEGVPLCHMEEYYPDNIEWKRLNWEPHYHIENDYFVEDCHRYNLTFYKAQALACAQCPLSFACGRVWKGYADIYGTDELSSFSV